MVFHLTNKRMQLRKDQAVIIYWIATIHSLSLSLKDFSVLSLEKKLYPLEPKENLSKMKYITPVIQNLRPITLYLF